MLAGYARYICYKTIARANITASMVISKFLAVILFFIKAKIRKAHCLLTFLLRAYLPNYDIDRMVRHNIQHRKEKPNH